MNIFRRLFGLSRKEKQRIFDQAEEQLKIHVAQAQQDLHDDLLENRCKAQGYRRYLDWLDYRKSNTYKIWCEMTNSEDIDNIWIYDLGVLIMEYYPAKCRYTQDDFYKMANEEYKRLKSTYE